MKRFFIGFVCVLSISISAVAQQKNTLIPLFVDLRDVGQFHAELMPDVKSILASMVNDADAYSPQQEVFKGSITSQQNPIAGIDKDQQAILLYPEISALMQSPASNEYFFRIFEISVRQSDHQVIHVRIQKDISLKDTKFSIRVGLTEQLAVLEDRENGIKIMYPVGVGALDMGVMKPGQTTILTPLFSNAKLRRSTARTRRTTPGYYRGQPFLPITNSSGTTTNIAFHITILTDDTWKTKGPNFLVRGYDSHGCMRLRQKDLSELTGILMYGGEEDIPLSVGLRTYSPGVDLRMDQVKSILPELHPYPITTRSYQRVKNFAGPGQTPRFARDNKENLVVLEKVYATPDLSKLSGYITNPVNVSSLGSLNMILANPAP